MRATTKTSLVAAGILAAALVPWSPAAGQAPPPPGSPRVSPRPPGRPSQEDRRALYREERFIRHLYNGFLRRQPGPNELRAWVARMSEGSSPIDLVRDFMNSDEYFVRQTYRALLGREPDDSGMNAHVRALERGERRSEVLESILDSPEFRRQLKKEGRGAY